MSSLLLILLSAVLINVVAIAHIPAWRPFIGVVGTFANASHMAITVLLALPLATLLTYALAHGVLNPLGIGYLRTMAVFAVIIGVASLAGLIVHRAAGLVPARPGFPILVMTNCALPGIAFFATDRARGFWDVVLVATVSALAFAGMLLAFAALYERLRYADVPRIFRDAPLALITIGIVALAFMGFTGLVRE